MPELPADIGQEELILRVRNERRVELALEGFRYFDVRRWTSPDGNLSKTDRWLTGMAAKRVEGPGGEVSYTYTRRALRERLCYQNRFLWVPIPPGRRTTWRRSRVTNGRIPDGNGHNP